MSNDPKRRPAFYWKIIVLISLAITNKWRNPSKAVAAKIQAKKHVEKVFSKRSVTQKLDFFRRHQYLVRPFGYGRRHK